jgi:hypothetical protein
MINDVGTLLTGGPADAERATLVPARKTETASDRVHVREGVGLIEPPPSA